MYKAISKIAIAWLQTIKTIIMAVRRNTRICLQMIGVGPKIGGDVTISYPSDPEEPSTSEATFDSTEITFDQTDRTWDETS